jgi:hypothetical protein
LIVDDAFWASSMAPAVTFTLPTTVIPSSAATALAPVTVMLA